MPLMNGTYAPARRLLLLATIVTAAPFLAAPGARADIFKYVNDEGVECFTDAPSAGGATRILRERTTRQRTVSVRAAARQKATAEVVPASFTPQAPDNARTEEIAAFPVRGVLTSPTGLRVDPIDGTLRLHQGVDIAIPEGTPVKPVAAGTVIFSGWRGGYGNTVVVQHRDGMTTLYGHNRLNLAKQGDVVGRETAIAFSGSTGRSTGPHLHFEAWKDGSNLTESFIPPEYPRQAVVGASSHRPMDDGVRRVLQPDGSILFTNLR
jgi:murein DD-endopeptidase MepM/ murein hydrolase activator NlpD